MRTTVRNVLAGKLASPEEDQHLFEEAERDQQ